MKKEISKEEYHYVAIKDLLAKITRINKTIQFIREMEEPETLSLDSLLTLKSQFTDELVGLLFESNPKLKLAA